MTLSQGGVVFERDIVKVNPLFELYGNVAKLPANLSHLSPNFHAEFQADFLDHVVARVARAERKSQYETEIRSMAFA